MTSDREARFEMSEQLRLDPRHHSSQGVLTSHVERSGSPSALDQQRAPARQAPEAAPLVAQQTLQLDSPARKIPRQQ